MYERYVQTGLGAPQDEAPLTDLPQPARAPGQHDPESLADEEFASRVLYALVAMAARSNRRQADVTAALCGAGLPVEPWRVRAALQALHAQGCIENLVPLSDGGLLLSVTRLAAERLAPVLRLLPLMDLATPAG